MRVFMLATDVLRGQGFLGEFVPSRGLDVQTFAGGEDLSREAGAVGGVVGDEESLAVLRDEGGDVHLAGRGCVPCNVYGEVEKAIWKVGWWGWRWKWKEMPERCLNLA